MHPFSFWDENTKRYGMDVEMQTVHAVMKSHGILRMLLSWLQDAQESQSVVIEVAFPDIYEVWMRSREAFHRWSATRKRRRGMT